MILAIDAYYGDSDAYVVGVMFDTWTSSSPTDIISCHCSEFSPYIPGEFYKRELPGIMELLKQVDLSTISTILIDGFVNLPGRSGLGGHLWDILKTSCPEISIVGVSKSKFEGCETVSIPVFRGTATTPLWVNTNGNMSNEDAALSVKRMHGKYKLPGLLKILDKETKKYKKK